MPSVNAVLVMNSIIYSFLGIIIFVGFAILDRITPYKLWEEICVKNNIALSIFVGLCALGIAVIIASAIH